MTRAKGNPAASRRAGWRNRSAIFLGKMLIGATRLLKRGGTTLPGRAALKISPELISFLSGQLTAGTTVITGTNGKTTTASLLAAICKAGGRPCVHNTAGANLAWGIASTLIEAGTWQGRLPKGGAILEVDEGAFPALTKNLRPRVAVLTNIFRDQLDRFGGVEQVRAALQKGVQALPPEALLLLNADDPLTASIDGGTREILYFGLALAPTAAALTPEKPKWPCPRCGRELHYTRVYFAHLGRYRCPHCGFHRPEPEFRLHQIAPISEDKTALTMSLRGRSVEAVLPLPGIYNLYNALAAAAAAAALSFSENAIKEGLSEAVPPSGRMEHRRVASRELVIALIKNPAGANQVLATLFDAAAGQKQRTHLFIAINNHPADGTDLSWLWETDFEQLASAGAPIATITLSGTGASELARRLEKTGLEQAGTTVEAALPRALRQTIARAAPGEKVIVLPNYTALQQVRQTLDRLSGKPL